MKSSEKYHEKIVNCKEISAKILNECFSLSEKLKKKPAVAIFILSDDPASEFYASNIEKDGRKYDFKVELIREKPESFFEKFTLLNKDPEYTGVMVQFPVPESYCENQILEKLHPLKDIDGLGYGSIRSLYLNQEGHVPSTPQAVMEIISEIPQISAGSQITVIGRSRIVGLPLLHLLLRKNFTPCACHSRTSGIKEICRKSQVIVAAAGKPELVDSEYLSENQILIDVGTSFYNGKWTGDFKFEDCLEKCAKITPVPGGVGTVTRAVLYRNILRAALWQQT